MVTAIIPGTRAEDFLSELETDPTQPAYRSTIYREMAPKWELVKDLWGDTLDIREMTTKYLPMMPLEDASDYSRRLEASAFYNVFQATVNTGVGMVFKTDPTPTRRENTSPIFKEIFEDIDLCGNDMESFLRESFSCQCRDGGVFILIDAPSRLLLDSDGKTIDYRTQTLEDVKNFRPFWINYEQDQALNWQYIIVNGKPVLLQIVFEEKSLEPNGAYGDKESIKYRVLYPGGFKLFKLIKKTEDNKEPKDRIEFVEEGLTGLDVIPLVFIPGSRKRKGLYFTTPPLLELACLNILHYQKSSDIDNWSHIACVPILARTLMSEEDVGKSDVVAIGPTVMVNLIGEHAKLEYVEVSGSGMTIAEKRIEKVEKQMAKLGIEIFAPNDSIQKTATEVVSDISQQSSELALMAKNLENGVKMAIYFTVLYLKQVRKLNIPDSELQNIQLNIEYDKLTFSLNQMQFFMQLVEKYYLSIETFLEWLPRIANMPKGFNVAQELGRIKAELPLRPIQQTTSEVKVDKNPPNNPGNKSGK